MLLQKKHRYKRSGVGISSMRKSIYLLTTTPTSYIHRFHPLPLATPTLHNCHPYFELAQVKSMDDNCGEWVECMGVASGCGEQEAGVASGSGWNLWVWLLGVVVRRYIDFLILLLLYLFFFCSSIPTFCSLKKKMFFILVPVLFVITFYALIK